MPFIPHTEEDVQQMLSFLGVNSISELFSEIPQALQVGDLKGVPVGLNEYAITRLMKDRASKDGVRLSFLGAGAYDHHIPAAVWEIATRGEFYSSYTPYQAEASQGTLQLIYEYQTMMASLTALDVSNASLYDGASALAEACLMAVRIHKKSRCRRILLPEALHPRYRAVIETICLNQELEFHQLGCDPLTGQIASTALENAPEATALVVAQPNFFGVLEDVDKLERYAKEHGLLLIGLVNPMSLGILKPPGEWGDKGADIACGDGQPLGIPLSSGGPYFGFMTCRSEHVRQLPGRIVGRTKDSLGRDGYVLTLQAREQHIRRSRATSNICTNQGLAVTAATIYMALVGPMGLKQIASACHGHMQRLLTQLQRANVRARFSGPFFHETVVDIGGDASSVWRDLLDREGIVAGYPLGEDFPSLSSCLLVCTTETKLEEDMDDFVEALVGCMPEPTATDDQRKEEINDG